MAQPRKAPTKTEVQPAKAPSRKAPVRKGVSVRFDGTKKLWGLLGPDNNPLEHFEFGYMKNVTFSHLKIHNGLHGCGSHYDYVGIATGDLVVRKYHKDQTNLANLGFNGKNFVEISSGAVYEKTSLLHLLPNRKALAKAQ